MELIRGYQAIRRDLKGPVLTLGNFDGVHLGHQKIISSVIEQARARGVSSAVYTFRPHPQVALRPDNPPALLTTYDEKIEILASLGVDLVIEEPFSREFSTLSPELFFQKVIAGAIRPSKVIVGFDFGFGKERTGGLESLRDFCRSQKIEFQLIEQQFFSGEPASSSRIRSILLSGNVDQAIPLLGRPYSYRGRVVRGDARGRGLGFPTANLHLDEKLALPHGVYATRSYFEGKAHPSVTNIGVRPTFGDQLPLMIETHVIDYSGDLYGAPIEVSFIKRIRDEMKFNSREELIQQILRDVDQAKAILNKGF